MVVEDDGNEEAVSGNPIGDNVGKGMRIDAKRKKWRRKLTCTEKTNVDGREIDGARR